MRQAANEMQEHLQNDYKVFIEDKKKLIRTPFRWRGVQDERVLCVRHHQGLHMVVPRILVVSRPGIPDSKGVRSALDLCV